MATYSGEIWKCFLANIYVGWNVLFTIGAGGENKMSLRCASVRKTSCWCWERLIDPRVKSLK